MTDNKTSQESSLPSWCSTSYERHTGLLLEERFFLFSKIICLCGQKAIDTRVGNKKTKKRSSCTVTRYENPVVVFLVVLRAVNCGWFCPQTCTWTCVPLSYFLIKYSRILVLSSHGYVFLRLLMKRSPRPFSSLFSEAYTITGCVKTEEMWLRVEGWMKIDEGFGGKFGTPVIESRNLT